LFEREENFIKSITFHKEVVVNDIQKFNFEQVYVINFANSPDLRVVRVGKFQIVEVLGGDHGGGDEESL